MRAKGVGLVRLRVRDLGRALEFYRGLLGLVVVREEGSSVRLAPAEADGPIPEGPAPILRLDEDSAAPPRPDRTTGLFHVALVVPSRRALAGVLAHLMARRGPLHGASDHAVSEALYLEDPEGNGIEIYADRPRSQWRQRHGDLHVTTEPLDVNGLLAELDGGPGTSSLERTGHRAPRPSNHNGLPSGTVVGHIHLQVSDLPAAEQFYVGVLGFDVTVRGYPGALFMSAGGYHHHVAVNVWSSRRAPRPPVGAAGLVAFEVLADDVPAEQRLKDPDGHTVIVRS